MELEVNAKGIWIEHINHDSVFQKAIVTRRLLKTLKCRRTKIIEHLLRYNSFLSERKKKIEEVLF